MLPIPATQLNRSSAPPSGILDQYWSFYHAVAAAQLGGWLPDRPARVVDLSGGRGRWAGQAASAGHRVIALRDPRRAPGDDPQADPRLHRVMADRLDFLREGSVDAVLAEERALSMELLTEPAVAEIARTLRPGGRLLASVDSLVLGMAILAEQEQWAHLRTTADVMLIPWPDGSISRCFSEMQLRELLTGAGLVVEWIRPRTVLSPSAVQHALSARPKALQSLVQAELSAHPEDLDTVGIHLLVSARRPG